MARAVRGVKGLVAALLKVDATSIEFWHVDKPAVVRAVEVARALITKTAPDVASRRLWSCDYAAAILVATSRANTTNSSLP